MGAIGAIGAGLGLAQGVAGAIGAQQAKKRARNAIQQAYAIAHAQLAGTPGHEGVFASTNHALGESLNARGILSGGGAAPSGPMPAETRYTPNIRVGTANLHEKGTSSSQAQADQYAQMYREAGQGAVGAAANTLAGQAASDQTYQNYLQNKDLDSQRYAEEQGVNAQAMQATINSLAGGVSTALSGWGMRNAGNPGMPSAPNLDWGSITDPAVAGALKSLGINANPSHAFGIDAVAPTANPSSNATFNVLGNRTQSNSAGSSGNQTQSGGF